ncbi:hypothetical protein [Wenzhouxiangella sp. EGI_FJ10409]
MQSKTADKKTGTTEYTEITENLVSASFGAFGVFGGSMVFHVTIRA